MFIWPTLPQRFGTGPNGPPAASNGPSATCKADMRKTSCMDRMYDAVHQVSTYETICMANKQNVAPAAKTGPARRSTNTRAWTYKCKTWSQRTSETNDGQLPPEWSHICSCEPLITMGPSDGHSGAAFQKWSLRTACNLRWTTCNLQGSYARNDLHGQDVRYGSTGQHVLGSGHGPLMKSGSNS